MDSTVTLLVTRGPLAGRKFVFSEPTTCLIGRSCDCTIPIPKEIDCMDVSRQHCAIDIDPPYLHVRDLGSLNGTYVNGKKIGQRVARLDQANLKGLLQPKVELQDGDEIRLGECTALRVCILTLESDEHPRKDRRSSGELTFQESIPS